MNNKGPANNNDNKDKIVTQINSYLDNLVSKNEVKNALYLDGNQWKINSDLFEKDYLNSFFYEENKNFKFNFQNLQFDFGQSDNYLTEQVNINYWLYDRYNDKISASCNILYNWNHN